MKTVLIEDGYAGLSAMETWKTSEQILFQQFSPERFPVSKHELVDGPEYIYLYMETLNCDGRAPAKEEVSNVHSRKTAAAVDRVGQATEDAILKMFTRH